LCLYALRGNGMMRAGRGGQRGEYESGDHAAFFLRLRSDCCN
jgi:hypothetical protein